MMGKASVVNGAGGETTASPPADPPLEVSEPLPSPSLPESPSLARRANDLSPARRVNGNGEACTRVLPQALTPYQALVRGLSDRLVEAQRPIRILDAIKWDDDIERAFFTAGAAALPPVTADYYRRRPLPFDPEQKRLEFLALERDVRRTLGCCNPAGRILTRTCEEYRQVIDLLIHRGTPHFGILSERLYGGSADCLHAGGPSLLEFACTMGRTLDNLGSCGAHGTSEPTLEAAEVVGMLSIRLADYFGEAARVRVRLSDGIVADAAAGSDYIKIRGDARFSHRDVRLLEVHEGWVHLGTTLNGQLQPVCTFLSKGPPSSTVTQEGLAVLTEVFAFVSHPERVRRLAQRVEGVALAESGADFLDVYRFYQDAGCPPRESYHQAVRIFRGSLPSGCGPFTKDLCYGKGFVLVCNFLRAAVCRGLVSRVPLLFCGKTNLTDVRTLAQLADEGLVVPPRHLPPPFADLHALSAWLGYANFLGGLSPQRIDEDFSGFF
jgi:uncharacterized protein (TIGR02421 family)